MNRRNILFGLIISLAGVLALPPLTLLFIPDAVVHQAVRQALATKGIKLQAEKITTALPFGISATRLTVSDTAATWVTLDHVSLQLRLLPLLSGKIAANLSATTGAGKLTGSVTLLPRLQGNLQIKNLELSSFPLLATASGGAIDGTTQIDLTLSSTTAAAVTDGTARLLVRNVRLRGVRISNIPLPDVSFPELRGIVKIKGQTVVIDNLALQGNGIYLRLGGTLSVAAGSPLNLNLELMPGAEFMEQQKTVFLFMLPYQVSPGHFKLPIAGTLANPQLTGH